MDAHGGGSIIPLSTRRTQPKTMAHGPAAKGPGKGIRARALEQAASIYPLLDACLPVFLWALAPRHSARPAIPRS